MTYPYGMYGAPRVGNGLGGLPRRTVAVAPTTVSTRYDLQELTKYTPASLPNSTVQASPPILMNGKGIFYFSRSDTSETYRHTFDYSAAGIVNATSTLVASGNTNITQLPIVNDTVAYGASNCLWSQRVSATQTLFKYTNLRPFLVTWDGVGNSSFTYPDANAAGFAGNISSTSDSFVLPNGNFVVFGHVGTTTIRLAEYTPSLTFVRTLDIGSITGLAGGGFTAAVRKTSYGYVVAVTHQSDSNGGRSFVATLNPNCTTVISSRQNFIQNPAVATQGVSISTVCGEEGVVIVWQIGTYNAVNIQISSTGIIGASTATQYSDSGQPITAHANSVIPLLASLSGLTTNFTGCTKFAESTAPTLAAATTSAGSNRSFIFSARNTSGEGNVTTLLKDVQYTPVFNSTPISGFTGVWSSDVTKTVNAVYTMQEGINGQNLATDDDGFFYLSQQVANIAPQARLLRRVSR
jgi:hypothetical protein